MASFKRILFPVDFSAQSEIAARYEMQALAGPEAIVYVGVRVPGSESLETNQGGRS
jgi:hypothetical protein